MTGRSNRKPEGILEGKVHQTLEWERYIRELRYRLRDMIPPNLYWQRVRSSVLPPSDHLMVSSLGWIQLETTEQGHRFTESLKVSFQDTEQRGDEWRMGLGGRGDHPTGVGENAAKVTHDPQLVWHGCLPLSSVSVIALAVFPSLSVFATL